MKIRRDYVASLTLQRKSEYIKLTPEELFQAYEEQQHIFMAQELADNVAERIADAGKKGYYAPDWPERFGAAYAEKLSAVVDKNEAMAELYAGLVSEVVEQELKALHIDVETMERHLPRDDAE